MVAEPVVDEPGARPLGPVLITASYSGIADTLQRQCRRLGVAAATVPADVGLAVNLRRQRPSGVICDLVFAGDGATELLRTVAHYDRDLPLLCLVDQGEGAIDVGAPPINGLMLSHVETATRPLEATILRRFLAEVLA
jgi:hypothetical protein